MLDLMSNRMLAAFAAGAQCNPKQDAACCRDLETTRECERWTTISPQRCKKKSFVRKCRKSCNTEYPHMGYCEPSILLAGRSWGEQIDLADEKDVADILERRERAEEKLTQEEKDILKRAGATWTSLETLRRQPMKPHGAGAALE